jgi:ribosomal protein L7/L12
MAYINYDLTFHFEQGGGSYTVSCSTRNKLASIFIVALALNEHTMHVEAIKYLRSNLGLGLFEAKMFNDWIRENTFQASDFINDLKTGL